MATRLGWLIAAIAILALAFWRGQGDDGPEPVAALATTIAAPMSQPGPGREPAAEVSPPRVRPAPNAAPRPAEKREQLLRNPSLRDRSRQHELAPAADARWNGAVDRGGYASNDLDPAVRRLFDRVDLEPRYAEGGMIDGLVIQDMTSDHVLAKAGLRAGDRIERIQGTPLRDPADLPSLLARLGPNLSLCARRGEQEICRDLELD